MPSKRVPKNRKAVETSGLIVDIHPLDQVTELTGFQPLFPCSLTPNSNWFHSWSFNRLFSLKVILRFADGSRMANTSQLPTGDYLSIIIKLIKSTGFTKVDMSWNGKVYEKSTQATQFNKQTVKFVYGPKFIKLKVHKCQLTGTFREASARCHLGISRSRTIDTIYTSLKMHSFWLIPFSDTLQNGQRCAIRSVPIAIGTAIVVAFTQSSRIEYYWSYW